jgi:UPF0716 protein FxsA
VPILLLLFIIVPIVEIALFIQVGGWIGLWPTIGCVVLTAIVGTFLLRLQGMQVLRQAQQSLQNDRIPVDSVVHGAFLLAAGLLLLTPGFFTDAVGFALLIPPVRLLMARAVWQRLKGNVQVYTSGGPGAPGRRPGPGGGGQRPGIIIDGEAEEVETDGPGTGDDGKDATGASDPNTPWRPR